jgi:hypothetical protein
LGWVPPSPTPRLHRLLTLVQRICGHPKEGCPAVWLGYVGTVSATAPHGDAAARRPDLHSLAWELVSGAADGRWTIFDLGQELHRRHPVVARRDVRQAIWDCLNGGVIRLRVEPDGAVGLQRRRLAPGHGAIEKARVCERFRLRAVQERAAA